MHGEAAKLLNLRDNHTSHHLSHGLLFVTWAAPHVTYNLIIVGHAW